jgi:hypothetical protein
MKRKILTKRAMVTATRVVGKEEGNGKGSKGDSQWDTSYVLTPEPRTELTALVLVEDIFVLELLYSCAPFSNLARKWTCPCPFQKDAQEIKPSLTYPHPSRFCERIYFLHTMVSGQKTCLPNLLKYTLLMVYCRN